MMRKFLLLALLAATGAQAQTVVGTIDVGNALLSVQITDAEDSNLTDNIAIIVTNNTGTPYVCSGRIGFYNLSTGGEDPSWAVTGQSTIPAGGPYTLVSATNPLGSGEGNTTAFDTASCSAQSSSGGSGGSGGTGSPLVINGNVSYKQLQPGNEIQINVDQVANNSSTFTSGSLHLELWALTAPMQGTPLAPPGYKMADAPLPTQCGGASSVLGPLTTCNGIVLTAPLTFPPPGTYYATLFLTMFDPPTCTTSDSYCYTSYVNFPDTFTVTSGGQPGDGAGGVDFVGASTWSISNGSLAITVAELLNRSNSRTTGSLRFDVWAFPSPYAAGQPNTGYELLTEPLQNACTILNGQLSPGEFCQNVSFTQALMATPPAGTYYVTIFVEEYDPVNCTTISHYCVDSSINYSGTLTIGAPPPPPPPSSTSSGGGGGAIDWLSLLPLCLLGALRFARRASAEAVLRACRTLA